MYDAGKIFAGLAIFVGLLTSPVWYNALTPQSGEKPELVLGTEETACVADTEYMRASHMDLLYTWRDDVVRDGQRVWLSPVDGRQHDKSLTETCLGCHAKPEEFCDRCHTYASVEPNCWSCHLTQKGKG